MTIRTIQLRNQRADTPAEIAERIRYETIRKQVCAERRKQYPVVTDANFDDAVNWQDARLAELRSAK